MDYGGLIRDAWAATWRYRYLWVLGLFAGGAAGVGSGDRAQWQLDESQTRDLPAAVVEFGDRAGSWLGTNWVPLALAAAIAGFAIVALSLIAQGGMARATADIAEGRGSSLGKAWRAGLHFGWRYAGLWLTLAAIAVVAAVLVAVPLAFALGAGSITADAPRAGIVVALVLLLIPLGLVAMAAAVVASIVVTFAQRAVAIEDEGPVAALRDGWRLFRHHVGPSVLAWLVNVALSIGASIAMAVAIGVAFAILGLLGVALWAVLGTNVATVIYAALAGAALVAAALAAAAIANTFFWHYWTLAYLRLRGDAIPA